MLDVDIDIDTSRGGHRLVVRAKGTTVETPPVEHLFFYAGVGTLAALDVVEWPIAVLLMIGHLLLDATNRPALHELGEALGEV